MGSLFNRGPGVNALSGKDAEITWWNFRGERSGVEPGDEIGGAADSQTAFSDCPRVVARNIVGVNLNFLEARKMARDHASERPTADNADLYRHAEYGGQRGESSRRDTRERQ